MKQDQDSDYDSYDDNEDNLNDDITDSDDSDMGSELFLIKSAQQGSRNWRDAEKYKEMKELNRLINDELYNGFDVGEYLRDEGY